MRTFDIEECAAFLKVDRTTALKLAGNGDLPGARIGRAWVFLEDDLIDYLRLRVRQQQAERRNELAVDEGLAASARRTTPMMNPLLAKRAEAKKKRELPELPELAG